MCPFTNKFSMGVQSLGVEERFLSMIGLKTTRTQYSNRKEEKIILTKSRLQSTANWGV